MTDIKSLLTETRLFEPSVDFVAQARIKKAELERLREESRKDYEGFWAARARETLTWDQDFTTTLKNKPPFVEWFVGGKL
ncbi:MAG: acetyl-coenzyme A synthetase, partial [Deltaproteobacteria bacterium]|nr:acetyl-coenzyme A synthetase [Deltaproteobacteria bacterium]